MLSATFPPSSPALVAAVPSTPTPARATPAPATRSLSSRRATAVICAQIVAWRLPGGVSGADDRNQICTFCLLPRSQGLSKHSHVYTLSALHCLRPVLHPALLAQSYAGHRRWCSPHTRLPRARQVPPLPRRLSPLMWLSLLRCGSCPLTAPKPTSAAASTKILSTWCDLPHPRHVPSPQLRSFLA